MISHMQKFIEIMDMAIPANGQRPKTKAGWKSFERASLKAASHFYQATGTPREDARRLARILWRSGVGRFLLEQALDSVDKKEAGL